METIIAASRNRHKIVEIEAITKKFGMEILSRDEAGLPSVEVEEDGDTFEENSRKKAEAILQMCGRTTIADDSGLMVDALDGAPGVYSARFAGEDATDAENNQKLLALLAGKPREERGAKFVSVITLMFPDGETMVARGECAGHLLEAPAGENGFGYDPLFVPEGFSETFAQLPSEVKNQISHRARALAKLEALLEERNR